MPPRSARSDLQFRSVRLATFVEGTAVGGSKIRKKWDFSHLSSDHMADSGFYYTPSKAHPEQVTCFWCNKKEYTFGSIDSICQFHHDNNPHCLYSTISLCLEKFVKATDKSSYWQQLGGDYGPDIIEPLCEESLLLRKATFKDLWKFDRSLNTKVTSRGLAEAGFYYSPVEKGDDRVICMYCDCPLSDWALEDDPLTEHSRNSFEYCYFLDKHRRSLQNGSQRKVKNKNTTSTVTTLPSVSDLTGNRIAGSFGELSTPVSAKETTEKDAFDFSIEELQNHEKGTIFDGKLILPKQFTRKRKLKEAPRVATIRQEAAAEPKVLSPPKKRLKSLRDLKRTVQEEIERALRNLSQSSEIESSNVIESDEEETGVEEDSYKDAPSGDVNFSEYKSGSDSIEVSESDASFSAETSSIPEKNKLRATRTQPKKRTSLVSHSQTSQFDDDDFGLNEIDIERILNSPKKARKVKTLRKLEALSPSGSLYDNSNQNLGDYEEDNLSFMERNLKPIKLLQAKAEKVTITTETTEIATKESKKDIESSGNSVRVLPSEVSLLELSNADNKTGNLLSVVEDKGIKNFEAQEIENSIVQSPLELEVCSEVNVSNKLNSDLLNLKTDEIFEELPNEQKRYSNEGSDNSKGEEQQKDGKTKLIQPSDAILDPDDEPTKSHEVQGVDAGLVVTGSLEIKAYDIGSNGLPETEEKESAGSSPKVDSVPSKLPGIIEGFSKESAVTDSIILENSPLKVSKDYQNAKYSSETDPGPNIEDAKSKDDSPLELDTKEKNQNDAFGTPVKAAQEDHEEVLTISPSSYRDYQKDLEEMDIQFVADNMLDGVEEKDSKVIGEVRDKLPVLSTADTVKTSLEISSDSFVMVDSVSELLPVGEASSEETQVKYSKLEPTKSNSERSMSTRSDNTSEMTTKLEESPPDLALLEDSSHKKVQIPCEEGAQDAVTLSGAGGPAITAAAAMESNPTESPINSYSSPPAPTVKSPTPPSKHSTAKGLPEYSDVGNKPEVSFSALSFDDVDASTPRKPILASTGTINTVVPLDCPTQFPSISLDFAYSQMKILEDAIQHMSELATTKFELHNDADGYLTEFIAAMPEKEESMSIQDWILENLAQSEQTVASICNRILRVYLEDFEKVIALVENMSTID